MFNALTCDEDLAVKLNACSTCGVIEEELTHGWHYGTSRRTKTVGIHRNIAPTKWTQTFFGNNLFNSCNCSGNIGSSLRKERNTHGVCTSSGKIETSYCSQERIRNLNKDSRTVTSVWFSTSRTAVLHVCESSETKRHDVTTADTFDIGNEGNATCVVFKPRVVETVGSGEIWVHERRVLQEPCRARRRMRLFSRGDADPSNARLPMPALAYKGIKEV